MEIRNVLLFINLHKTKAPILAKEISETLERKDIEVFFSEFTEKLEFRNQNNNYDISFTLGGDGTVLYAARAMSPLEIPIFPINLGTIGFIASVPPQEWLHCFNLYLEGKVEISRRLMLEVSIERENKIIAREICLNDVVISSLGIAKVIKLNVESNYMRLGKYRSDGLIIATPTGSTAYSVSAGGPILDPELSALIINPICPFSLSNRPVVVPASEILMIEVEKEQRSEILLTLDGQISKNLKPEDKVHIKQAPFFAKIISSNRVNFYNALRTKLSWQGGSANA